MTVRTVLFSLGFAAAALVAPVANACPTHAVSAPSPKAKGPAVEPKELLATPFVKVVSITLRDGAKLEKHTADVPVTIQAVSGSAKLRVGKQVDSLGPGQLVLVGPGAEHEIVPDGKETVVLLVQFLPMGAAADVAAHHAEEAKHGAAKHDHAKPDHASHEHAKPAGKEKAGAHSCH